MLDFLDSKSNRVPFRFAVIGALLFLSAFLMHSCTYLAESGRHVKFDKSLNPDDINIYCKEQFTKIAKGDSGNRSLSWCQEKFSKFVSTSPDYDHAYAARLITNWQDANYDHVCERYLTSPGTSAHRAWCKDYVHLLPSSKTYAGDRARDMRLFQNKRYQHACFEMSADRAQANGCSGYVFRDGLKSWRETETEWCRREIRS